MYLLDTCSLIWFLSGDSRLSKKALDAICSTEKVFVSCVSLWEIALKKNLGKLRFDYTMSDVEDMCREDHIEIIPIKSNTLDYLAGLPFIHRDPFDRYIISTAMMEGLDLITDDSQMPKYDVKVLW